ncbi:hypothetical protein GA0070609_2988 [Micromonospora echinaurantiaca]|uniref:Uncharacterized protein n=1 Tax=Micromonospora echinaurantiaca TaxID=47857 RepID=A0A1C5IA05_9ACTN|nr:hypothetical protein [Micromonospora echinaurantiaca]SCG54949.1 hypothetical protein GA0070609_2988 [Micromonospora echinaurantiaca]
MAVKTEARVDAAGIRRFTVEIPEVDLQALRTRTAELRTAFPSVR